MFNKIKEDGIVTLQEVDDFGKLMDQYEKELSMGDDSMDREYIKLRESLRHQAEKEVRVNLNSI